MQAQCLANSTDSINVNKALWCSDTLIILTASRHKLLMSVKILTSMYERGSEILWKMQNFHEHLKPSRAQISTPVHPPFIHQSTTFHAPVIHTKAYDKCPMGGERFAFCLDQTGAPTNALCSIVT